LNRIINNILIAGGGSSGWMAAAHLRNNLPPSVKISLIESTTKGIIGVGEGTQPFTTQFLRECGLAIDEWMPLVDGAFKLGVEFQGWCDNPAFVDNDVPDISVLGPGIMMHDYVLAEKMDKEKFVNWNPSYALGKHNKSPKFFNPNLDYAYNISDAWDAVHFKADAIVKMLSTKFKDKLEYYDDMITDVYTNESGVIGIQTENNGILSADLYIDCTGFKSLLLEGALGEPFQPIDHLLLCNRAVAMPKEYTNKEEEMHPYTKATAMDAGWRWTIPTYSRVGNGYVYSDKFISSDEAEFALRSAINEWDAPANHLIMKTGTHKNIALKNVFATGLAAAFVEPLEATGITFTTKGIQSLTNALRDNQGYYNDQIAQALSQQYNSLVQEIIDFVFIHYHFAKKNDTPFWQAVHNIPVPETTQRIISEFLPNPPNTLVKPGAFTMFHVGQWFSLLYAFGAYDGIDHNVPEEVKQYGKMVWDLYQQRTDQQIKTFPNHSKFLENWYVQ
jgi:hypothetical protein